MSLSVKHRRWSLAVVWIIGILAVVIFGFQENAYLQHVNDIQAVHPYPYKQVGQFILVMSIEIILSWLILRPKSYQRSWGRALGAFVLSTGFTLWIAMGMMHASPARIALYYWLIAVTIGMLALTLWSLISKGSKD